MSDDDIERGKKLNEDLELLAEARDEYVERMQSLAELTGEAFNTAAAELETWVAEVNDDLNDVAQDMLGESLAIDCEALFLLRMSRHGSPK